LKQNGLYSQCGLSQDETAQLHELAAICRQEDGVDIKFNYSMIANRKTNDLGDFCWFHEGKLVGYVSLDRFGRKGEITVAVHPEFRRQGIFMVLYNAAVEQAKVQNCSELLLVSYRDSSSGAAALRKLCLPYKVSEYCMKAKIEDIPNQPASDVMLIAVTSQHVQELSNMLNVSFPETGWGSPTELLEELSEPSKRYYLAQTAGTTIGHIGVTIGDNETYIRGVGILPEWRRRGFGRKMLAETLRRHIGAGATQLELDVATENEGALNIYTACGFRQSNVYDYYLVF
jgi:ribosomal protein S18 acetylase RimI-like enzyme